MSVIIPSGQIYAGRYHYQKMQQPDLFAEIKNGTRQVADNIRFLPENNAYTVTFSEEGLANARALREYAIANPLDGQEDLEAKIDDFNKRLYTTNLLDPASMFYNEIRDVCSQIKDEYHLPEHSSSWMESLTIKAKAYQTIYDRVEEEFADPNRETTYLLNDGEFIEETKEDRMNALNKAYQQNADFSASSVESFAVTARFTGKGNYSAEEITELQDKVKQSYADAISEKNMERLRQKVTSFKDYSLDTSIGSEWLKSLDLLFYT
jgi:hypothetical protein